MTHAKYEPLGVYLAAQTDDAVTLSFRTTAAILGAPLPPSAWAKPFWWNGRPTVQADVWRAAGWWVYAVQFKPGGEAVSFVRLPPASAPEPTAGSG